MDINKLIRDNLTEDMIGKIAGQIGADSDSTKKGIGAALPMLLGALGKNAESEDGAKALGSALDRDHDGGALNDVQGLLGGKLNGAGILKHILGGKKEAAEEGLGGLTGLGKNSSGKLLEVLAPIVMGALGKKKKEGGLNIGDLAKVLLQNKNDADEQSGGIGGKLLGALLDKDGDGDIKDDLLGGLAKNALGGLFKK